MSREIRRFKRYPAYKDSRVEWLGEIPEHWLTTRADSFLRFEKIQVDLSAVSDEVVFHYSIPHVQETGDGAFESPTEIDSAKLRVCGHRLLVSKLNPRKGVVLIASEKEVLTVCSSEFIPLVSVGCDLRWALYLYSAEPSRQALSAVVRSATRSHQRAEIADITKMWHAVPPVDEQRAVVAFLDRETARIDALVAKKERLIELLQEKRSALITRAVTKGLDPKVPMKDSGVEWLGDIPRHWAAIPLAYGTILRCDGPFGSGLKSEHYVGSGVRVVRLQNIGWSEFLDNDQAYIDETYAGQLGDHSVVEGDLLIAGLGDESNPVGRACVAPAEIEPAMVKADCFRFRLDQRRLLPDFAAHQLSAMSTAAAGSLASGATRARMNLTTTAARKIAVPPIPEQRAIIDCVTGETRRYTVMVERVRAAIEKLEELRTALISAAVTGKIDVREEVA